MLGAEGSSRRILAGIAWPHALDKGPLAENAWPLAEVVGPQPLRFAVISGLGVGVGAPHAG